MSTIVSIQAARESRAAADILERLPVLEGHNVVNVSLPSGGLQQFAVEIHNCTPDQLDRVAWRHDGAEVFRDAADIVRCVSIDVSGAAVTFFRR